MVIKLAIIGGSGAYELSPDTFGKLKESTSVSTPFGSVSPIHIFDLAGLRYSFISRHGEKGYSLTASFVNYRANIWALKELGAERIIAWTGPGAINKMYHIGDYVIPHDLIDLTRDRPNTFFEGKGIGFIRQNPVFCPEIQDALKDIASKSGVKTHRKGVYLCTEGPRLETPAEIRFFKDIGADMVGMTLVPEAFLAKELEICYGTLCYITNYAEGTRPLPYQKGVLFEGTLPADKKGAVSISLKAMPSILINVLNDLAQRDRGCPCKDSMLRYRIRGDINPDWRNWIK